jgi:predicted GIY-YIG superfamily endonuclease
LAEDVNANRYCGSTQNFVKRLKEWGHSIK